MFLIVCYKCTPNVKVIGASLIFRRETLCGLLRNVVGVRVIIIMLVSGRRKGLVKEKLEKKTQLLYYSVSNKEFVK